MAALMLPRTVLTHLKCGFLADFAPLPVLTGVWVPPAPVTALKQRSASDTACTPSASAVPASLAIAILVNPATRRRMIWSGLPAAVTATAATKGHLPPAPPPYIPGWHPPI